MAEIAILSGRKPKAEKLISLSTRPSTLQGKTVALYHNDKVASYPVMKTVGRLLKEKMSVQEVFEVHAKTPYSRHPDSAVEEALDADVVVAGTCD
ncbi:MAG: hypothetical protein V1915_02755 [Candidatus Bathyarchaeota archaeon]